MDFGKMLGESFDYTKSGLVGQWGKWILLFISMVIFPVWYGFTWKIFKGEKELPALEGWVEMFINGIKLIIVTFIYLLIPMIVMMVLGGGGMMSGAMMNDPGAAAAGMGLGLIIGMIFCFIFALFAIIAMVRFARTDSFGEAFNFNKIMEHIGKIGWANYIIALIIIGIILGIIQLIALYLMSIPVLGILVYLIYMLLIYPFLGVWGARYITMIYDSAEDGIVKEESAEAPA